MQAFSKKNIVITYGLTYILYFTREILYIKRPAGHFMLNLTEG